LNLRERRIFGEPLALGSILVTECALDVGVCDGKELLYSLSVTAMRGNDGRVVDRGQDNAESIDLHCVACRLLAVALEDDLRLASDLAGCCSASSSISYQHAPSGMLVDTGIVVLLRL
jgi:hypothetical protein